MPELVVPLGPNGLIDHWRLSPVHQERYDSADAAMTGDMDARFFLTQHRNFIPHEYPCRRDFAARFRDRRPAPATRFVQADGPAGWWFPFGADRVDLSGFWHRPTRVEAWGATGLRLGADGPVTLHLTTCGAALLTIDGADVLWMAPYQRNLESTQTATVTLSAGDHDLRLWFADLCERDTRWWFALSVEGGPAAQIVLPVPVEAGRVAALCDRLAGMHLDRPAAPDGAVAVRFDHPLAQSLTARVTVQGHFMSADGAALTHTLDPGSRGFAVAPVADLPADFRYYHVALHDGPMALARTLGTEVVDIAAQGQAPETLAARIDEALRHVAGGSEADPMGALARLALGRDGGVTDAMLAAAVPAIADCHDCADFLLVPLLWARIGWPDAIAPPLRAQIDDAILGFRYWLEEPGNDVMWFYSENHALLFHTACYLAGGLFPDAVFRRSGRTGAQQQALGRTRLLRWLNHFESCEMAEFNSAPYFPIDLKGLCALFALAPDAEIRTRAERSIHRLLEIVALASHQGFLAAAQGRSYEHTLRAARTLELSGIARMLWGRGWYGRQVQALPLLALAIRDHGLASPPAFRDIALWQDARGLEWCYVQGEGGFAPLYHYKTRDFAMGSVAAYRTGEWGYQETVLHLRLGDHPDAQIWINHPGEHIVSGFARPSYWGGCGTIPRVHQYRGLAWLGFAAHPDQPGFTHAHVPRMVLDEVVVEPRRVLIRAGRALALLQGDQALAWVETGPTAGFELRQPGHRSQWLVRLSDLDREGSLAAFGARMAGLTARCDADDAVTIDDPDYGPVRCGRGGTVAAEGRRLDPARWTHAGQATLSDGTAFAVPSHRAAAEQAAPRPKEDA